MKAETATLPNPFAEAFAALASGRAASRYGHVQEAAFAAFTRLGLPTVKEEAWRYTNLAPLTKRSFQLATADGLVTASLQSAIPFFDESATTRMVFVNGFFQRELSDLRGLPAGIEVSCLEGPCFLVGNRAVSLPGAEHGISAGQGYHSSGTQQGSGNADRPVFRHCPKE